MRARDGKAAALAVKNRNRRRRTSIEYSHRLSPNCSFADLRVMARTRQKGMGFTSGLFARDYASQLTWQPASPALAAGLPVILKKPLIFPCDGPDFSSN